MTTPGIPDLLPSRACPGAAALLLSLLAATSLGAQPQDGSKPPPSIEEIRRVAAERMKARETEFRAVLRDSVEIFRNPRSDDPASAVARARGRLLVFGSAGVPYIVEAIGAADSPAIVTELVETLVAIGDASVTAELRRRLDDRNPALVGAAIEALARLGAREALPDCRALLRSGDARLVAAAVQALGILADRDSAADIQRLLRSGDSRVRREAARALGRIGERSAQKPLGEIALADADTAVRHAALEALSLVAGSAGQLDALKILHEALESPEERTVLVALDGIERLANADLSKPHLRKLLAYPAEAVKRRTAQVLFRLGDATGVKQLTEGLRRECDANPDEGIRQVEYAEELRKLGDAKGALARYEAAWRKAKASRSTNVAVERVMLIGMARCLALTRNYPAALQKLRSAGYADSLRDFAGDEDFREMRAQARYRQLFE